MAKLNIQPAANYLIVSKVDIKDLGILNGPISERADKDVVAEVGYIESVGKNNPDIVSSNARLVIFNTKLSTPIINDDYRYYLVHKSAVIASIISDCTIFVSSINPEDSIEGVYMRTEIDINDKNTGLGIDELIHKYS